MRHHPNQLRQEQDRLERQLDHMHTTKDERTLARRVFKDLLAAPCARPVTLGSARRRAIKTVQAAREAPPASVPDRSLVGV